MMLPFVGHKILNTQGIILYTLSGTQAVRWPGVPKAARSYLSQCSKSCDLQPALNCAIRGGQGVLPCVGWGVRPVNWIYRL